VDAKKEATLIGCQKEATLIGYQKEDTLSGYQKELSIYVLLPHATLLSEPEAAFIVNLLARSDVVTTYGLPS